MYAEGQFIETSDPVYQSVSFVIPAHNESAYLGKTIGSIQAAARELEIASEIIVVNDDSTDNTRDIAIDKGATVVDVAIRNIGAVRNAGAKQAANDWLFFVDADTTVPTETLRMALDFLAIGGIGGGARVDIDNEQPLPWFKQLMYYSVVTVWQVIGGWAAGCFMFCPRQAFETFGGFDEEYFAAEEYFFSKHLKAMGRFRLVKHPVITSARKLYRYSSWDLVKFVFSPLVHLGQPFQSRRGLDILYEDQR